MAGVSDGPGPDVGLISAGSSALASMKPQTYNWHGCCDWYGFQGYVCSLSVP